MRRFGNELKSFMGGISLSKKPQLWGDLIR
jgi:hypothetical protein